jgi:hypothetical protein
MVKVVIKKNIKPKTTKQKQKQKQTQKTNVTVNIGSEVIKKKRGRPTKRSTIEKQPVKPVSQQPIIQSYNQPIFKQSTSPSYDSSILTPKIIKEESSFRKALIEQNLQTEEPVTKANDLEKLKNEKPKIEIQEDKTIRNGLINQRLSEQGDDTEELQSLFNTNELQQIFISGLTTPTSNQSILSLSGTSTPNPLSSPVNHISLSEKLTRIQDQESLPFYSVDEINQYKKYTQEVSQAEQQTEAPLTIQTEAPLLYEEEDQITAPINNNIDVNQGILNANETTSTILEEPKKEPSITQSLQAEEPVRQADQYTTDQLVKNEEEKSDLTRYEQIQRKWLELHDNEGPLKDFKFRFTNINKRSQIRPEDALLTEILSVDESFKPLPTGRKPGVKATKR